MASASVSASESASSSAADIELDNGPFGDTAGSAAGSAAAIAEETTAEIAAAAATNQIPSISSRGFLTAATHTASSPTSTMTTRWSDFLSDASAFAVPFLLILLALIPALVIAVCLIVLCFIPTLVVCCIGGVWFWIAPETISSFLLGGEGGGSGSSSRWGDMEWTFPFESTSSSPPRSREELNESLIIKTVVVATLDDDNNHANKSNNDISTEGINRNISNQTRAATSAATSATLVLSSGSSTDKKNENVAGGADRDDDQEDVETGQGLPEGVHNFEVDDDDLDETFPTPTSKNTSTTRSNNDNDTTIAHLCTNINNNKRSNISNLTPSTTKPPSTSKPLLIAFNPKTMIRLHELDKPCCDICMMEYEEGHLISESKNPECFHNFHKECILDWMQKKHSCPCCRRNYLGEQDTTATANNNNTNNYLHV